MHGRQSGHAPQSEGQLVHVSVALQTPSPHRGAAGIPVSEEASGPGGELASGQAHEPKAVPVALQDCTPMPPPTQRHACVVPGVQSGPPGSAAHEAVRTQTNKLSNNTQRIAFPLPAPWNHGPMLFTPFWM